MRSGRGATLWSMPTVSFSSSRVPARDDRQRLPGDGAPRRPRVRAGLAPAGEPLGSGTVDATNRVSITVSLPAGWSPNAPLVAYAQVAGEHKYVTAWAT